MSDAGQDAVLVLAAGKGTRMRSSLPKVLHRLAGKPLLHRVLDTARAAGLPPPAIVVGQGDDQIRRATGESYRYVEQHAPLGTGDAVRAGLAALPSTTRRVIVINGDEPSLPSNAFADMLAFAASAPIVLLTTHVDDTRQFGTVVRDESGAITALRQHDAKSSHSPQPTAHSEVNLGAYVFDAAFLRQYLERLAPHPPKGEYYLTDLVEIASREGLPVAAVTVPGGPEVMGVNDLIQLEQATQLFYRRVNRRLMAEGVTIVDTASTFIDDGVEIGPDTIIHPFTIITGASRIGEGCVIGPNAHLIDSRAGDRCEIRASTIEASQVGDDVRIGPYAYLGPRACIGDRAEIGSYAQIRRSSVGIGTRMHHFGYLGDARVGDDVNIGAGTVTCNFDGRAKHETVIEDGAFVGSDTMLRAPVTVGARASTGAGSVVIHDVEPGSVVAGVPAKKLRESLES